MGEPSSASSASSSLPPASVPPPIGNESRELEIRQAIEKIGEMCRQIIQISLILFILVLGINAASSSSSSSSPTSRFASNFGRNPILNSFLSSVSAASPVISDAPLPSPPLSKDERIAIRESIRQMFLHGYDNYMKYAYPQDELKPLSCSGADTWGSYSLTLVDSLDTLAVMNNATEFVHAVQLLSQLNFDRNVTVSVFETNIRVLGGLLSGHLLAVDPHLRIFETAALIASGASANPSTPSLNPQSQEPFTSFPAHLNPTLAPPSPPPFTYNGQLLRLAEDLGRRLLPAFHTPTGIPYGVVNLKFGVPHGETTITSTAGAGTFLLEFGLLSKLTGDTSFELAAQKATRSLYGLRSPIGLVGNHLDVFTGQWTLRDSALGAGADSFYEYLWKGHLLFGDPEWLVAFEEVYGAIKTHMYRRPFYFDVNYLNGQVAWPLYNSLQGFWPGIEAQSGRIEDAGETLKAFHSVWRKFGCVPEGFNLLQNRVQPGQEGYPLRPELAESTYFLYRTTHDPAYLAIARDIFYSLEVVTKTGCGYASVKNVLTHELEDRMESFFLAETVKYLYLTFDEENFVNQRPFTFNTEGHLIPLYPQFRSNYSSISSAVAASSTLKDEVKKQAMDEATEKEQAVTEEQEIASKKQHVKGTCPRWANWLGLSVCDMDFSPGKKEKKAGQLNE